MQSPSYGVTPRPHPCPARRHAMYDLAVPLFNLQHLWGVYRPDAQVLLLNQTSADSWQGIDYYARRMVITPDPQRSVFRLTWDSDATWTANYTRQVLGDGRDGLVCFKVGGAAFIGRKGKRWLGAGADFRLRCALHESKHITSASACPQCICLPSPPPRSRCWWARAT